MVRIGFGSGTNFITGQYDCSGFGAVHTNEKVDGGIAYDSRKKAHLDGLVKLSLVTFNFKSTDGKLMGIAQHATF